MLPVTRKNPVGKEFCYKFLTEVDYFPCSRSEESHVNLFIVINKFLTEVNYFPCSRSYWSLLVRLTHGQGHQIAQKRQGLPGAATSALQCSSRRVI